GRAHRPPSLITQALQAADQKAQQTAVGDHKHSFPGVPQQDAAQKPVGPGPRIRQRLAARGRLGLTGVPPAQPLLAALCDELVPGQSLQGAVAQLPQRLRHPQGQRPAAAHDGRRFETAVQVAGVNRGQLLARKPLGEPARLLPPALVEGNVGPSLYAAGRVPVGFSVPGQQEPCQMSSPPSCVTGAQAATAAGGTAAMAAATGAAAAMTASCPHGNKGSRPPIPLTAEAAQKPPRLKRTPVTMPAAVPKPAIAATPTAVAAVSWTGVMPMALSIAMSRRCSRTAAATPWPPATMAMAPKSAANPSSKRPAAWTAAGGSNPAVATERRPPPDASSRRCTVSGSAPGTSRTSHAVGSAPGCRSVKVSHATAPAIPALASSR